MRLLFVLLKMNHFISWIKGAKLFGKESDWVGMTLCWSSGDKL